MIPLTPFMLLILAGYAVFMGVLGVTWLQQFVAERRR